jgi:hypothetical protein
MNMRAVLILIMLLVLAGTSFGYYYPEVYNSNLAYVGTSYGYPSLLGQWGYNVYQAQPYPTLGGGYYYAPGYDYYGGYGYGGYGYGGYGYANQYPYSYAGYATVPLYGTSDLYYPGYYNNGYYSQYYGNCAGYYC